MKKKQAFESKPAGMLSDIFRSEDGQMDIPGGITRILLLLFFPLRFLVDGLSYPGFNFFWYLVFSVLTLVLILKSQLRVNLEVEEIWLLVFFGLCLVSARASPVGEIRWEFPLQILSSWMLMFLLVRTIRLRDDERLWWVLVAAGFLVTLYGLHQYFWGLEDTRQRLAAQPGLLENLPPTFLQRLESRRIFSTFFYPNVLASFLLMLFPIAYRGCFFPGRRLIFSSVLVFLIVWTLMLSGSVGGLLVLLFLLQWLLLRVSLRKHFWLVLLVLLLAETGALVVGYRTGHLPHLSSFQDRMRYWQAAMRVFQQWPWLGVGPGQFRFFYLRFKAPGAMEARHAHSLFFETLAEEGIWGTLVFFSLMALLLWKLVPFSGREITLEESLGLGFLAGWLHFLVDVSFIDEAVSSLFFLLAGWALSRKKGCPFPGRKGLTTITKRLTPAISYLIILIVVSAGILRIRINQAITYLDRADKVRYLNERLEWLRKARQLYPLSEFFVQEGDGYMMAANITGDGSWLVRAEEAYRMALARNQFSAIPYRKLALLYAQEKRWRKAEQMYLKCLENYPTKKQYVLELASLYRHTGQMEKYQHYLALALALPAVTKEEDDYTRRLLDGQDRSDRNAAGR